MSAFKPRALYDETVLYAPVTEKIGDYRFTVAFADIQLPKPYRIWRAMAASSCRSGRKSI